MIKPEKLGLLILDFLGCLVSDPLLHKLVWEFHPIFICGQLKEFQQTIQRHVSQNLEYFALERFFFNTSNNATQIQLS